MLFLKQLNKLIDHKIIRRFCKQSNKPPWTIVFFGSDKFSLYSLKTLTNEYRQGSLINKLDVVTTISKKPNPIESYSKQEKIELYRWPLEQMEKYDVGVVVSFGHLIPQKIIDNCRFGILNIHASLLPRWRGAAPIIYSIAKGDTKTGITIMRIKSKKFDGGDIVHQKMVEISPHTTLPELYDRLANVGSLCLLEILIDLPEKITKAFPQPEIGVTYAPKINIQFTQIDWTKMSSKDIYNLERSLFGIYHLKSTWKDLPIKLIGISIGGENLETNLKPGYVRYDKKQKQLKILCSDNKLINVDEIIISGKRMKGIDFHNGYIINENPDCRYFK